MFSFFIKVSLFQVRIYKKKKSVNKKLSFLRNSYCGSNSSNRLDKHKEEYTIKRILHH